MACSDVASIAFVAHSFLLDVDANEMLAWHFNEMTRLAELPKYSRLDCPHRGGDLLRVREAIIRHATADEFMNLSDKATTPAQDFGLVAVWAH